MAGYKPNDMEKEFSEFWKIVNCLSVLSFPYDMRCDFVKNANNCIYGTNVVPYMHLMSCEFKCRNQFEELIFVSIFLILCCELVMCLWYVANFFYSPALKVVSRMLHMNEHLAGMTIMAIGNALPQLFANLSAFQSKVPLFANSISTGIFVTMFIGGLVCYISPFKLSGYTTVRDLLFYIFGLMLLDYISNVPVVSLVESLMLIVVYVLYMTVSVMDMYLKSVAVKSLKSQIIALDNLPYSYENEMKQESLEKKYRALREDNRVDIRQRSTLHPSGGNFTFMTPTSTERPRVTIESHRLSGDIPKKNHHLFRQFFHSIKPFDLNDWAKASIITRAFYISRAPVAVIAAFYIPLVDYELEKNGWSKLLNCIQIFFNPAFTIVMMKSLLFGNKSRLWYYNIPRDIKYGLYSMIVTVPMAIFVFFNSNTSEPPLYHWVFTLINLSGSMFLNFQCCAEISLILDVIGTIMNVPSDFMGATVLTIATSLNDLVNNVTMTLHGYEKMAYAAAIGGPFFTIFMGTGIVLIAKLIANIDTSAAVMNGAYGKNAYVMLMLGVLSTLLWSSVLNFNARRSVGIFSMGVFGLYLVFTILIKNGVIQRYDADIYFTDTYVPR